MKIIDLILYSLIMIIFNIFKFKNYSLKENIADSIIFTLSQYINELIIYFTNPHKYQKSDLNILIFDSSLHTIIYEFFIYLNGNNLEKNKTIFENLFLTFLCHYFIEFNSKILVNLLKYIFNIFSSEKNRQKQLELIDKNIDSIINYDTSEVDAYLNALPVIKNDDELITISNLLLYDLNDFVTYLKPNVEILSTYSNNRDLFTDDKNFISYYNNCQTYYKNVLIIFYDYSNNFLSNLLIFIINFLTVMKQFTNSPVIKYFNFVSFGIITIQNAYIYTTTSFLNINHILSIFQMIFVLMLEINKLFSRLSIGFTTFILIDNYKTYHNIVKFVLEETYEFIKKTINGEKYISKKLPHKPKFLEIK